MSIPYVYIGIMAWMNWCQKMSSLEQQWILTSVFKVYKPSEDATKSTTEYVGVKQPLIVEEHEASFLCELV